MLLILQCLIGVVRKIGGCRSVERVREIGKSKSAGVERERISGRENAGTTGYNKRRESAKKMTGAIVSIWRQRRQGIF